MIQLVAVFIGFGFGWWRAGKRGGTTGDKMQYGVAHAFAFGLAAFAIALLLYQTGMFRPEVEG